MPTTSRISGARVLAAACLFVCLASHAQTSTPLYSTVHTVAASTTAVPVEETFNISAAGTYQITLTDIGAQLTPAAPLAAVKLAVSSGSTLVTLTAVGNATVSSNKTQLLTAGSATFSAQPGTYILHVVGAPTTQQVGGVAQTAPGSGPIALQVTKTSDNSQVAAFSGVLAFPPTNALSNVGTLNDTFTVPSSGNYTVTLTDMQLPSVLTAVNLAIAVEGAGSLVTPPTFGLSGGATVNTATVSLQAGVSYGIFAGGQSGSTPNAGLYGVSVSPAGGGAPVYSNTVPVGSVVSLGAPALTAASYTLSLADLAYPASLSQLGVVLALNGQSVVRLTATGSSSPFTATATNYQVFALGVAGSGSQGSYTVSVQPSGGAPVLSVARAVTDPASNVFTYSYDTTTVGSESYNFDLVDFGYPAPFASLSAIAVQGGTKVGNAVQAPSGSSGTQSIAPVAGPLTLLVFATPGTSSGNAGGLFGLDLTANGAGAPAFETSQGVGQLFSVQKVTVSSGGAYQVVVNDLGFPANFANLAVIVTRGTSKIGSIFGGGTLPFNATGGDYLVNFVAQPTSTDQAGTYSMVVQEAPPAATVTLAANPTSISSGGTTTLKWSSANTSSCTASSSPSGAWSGTVQTTDQFTTGALTATTTFTLTCVGTDGTNPSQSVTVTVNSSSGGGGGGGGGAIGADLVAFLLGLAGLRALPRRRISRC